MRWIGPLAVSAAVLVIGVAGVWAQTIPGQLTYVDVTECYLLTDFVVVKGPADAALLSDWPACAQACQVFVNGFVTYVSPFGGEWKICIPRDEVGPLTDPTTELYLAVIDMRTGVVLRKTVKLAGLVRQDARMKTFERLTGE